MSLYYDIIGKTYGRLTVIKRTKNLRKSVRLLCQCSCGSRLEVYKGKLTTGKVKSCGCWKREQSKIRFTTHGLSHTKVRSIWENIQTRCYNKNRPVYKYYGGKGVICEWKTFEEFFKDMGHPPSKKHSIDRTNSNGNYSKENCRWVTIDVQANNTSRNIFVLFKDEKFSIAQLWNKYFKNKIRIRLFYIKIHKNLIPGVTLIK